MENKVYKLSDLSISYLVKLLQLGLMTGTDVSDQFRTIRFVSNNKNILLPEQDYITELNENISRLLEEADTETPEHEPDLENEKTPEKEVD